MATTAQISDFSPSTSAKTVRSSHLRQLGRRIALACEARAIHRMRVDVGHLLTKEQMERIVCDYEARKAALQK
jgi:hypothetical protein